MRKTLSVIAADILSKKKGQKLTGHQLAEVIMKTESDFINRKIKKTGKTEKFLLFQLMSEIGAQYYSLSKNGVAKTSTRPTKYYYKGKAAARKTSKTGKAK